jgi:3-hydroxyisobutyrate dehydrogenase-like beta-hydroxyacid dehydrogenase
MTNKTMVIGLGRMGAALASTLLKNGDSITVWNRTKSKTKPLTDAGADLAESASAGIAVNDIIVICLGNYDDTKAVLNDCGSLVGKTLIQLTTAIAPEAREMENWAVQKGALYLDGSIIAFPESVGTEECSLLVAGSSEAWQESESTIMSLGGASLYLGDNVAVPIALDGGLILPGLVTTMSVVHCAHLVEREGFDVSTYFDMLIPLFMNTFETEMRRQADAIINNSFSDPQASLGTWEAGVTNGMRAQAEEGVDISLLEPISQLLQKAIKAGYGEQELAAVIKVMRSEQSDQGKAQ